MKDIKKVIILNSHPIQYFAPLYKEIAKLPEIDLEVWYCSKHGLNSEIDKQFGMSIKWDIPVLEGYKFDFLENYALNPSTYTFTGLLNLGVIKKLSKLPEGSLIIINGWGSLIYLITLFFAKFFGLKVAMRGEAPLHFELLRPKGIKMFLRKYSLRFLLSKIDYFLYIGTQNKLFYQYYGVPDEKLFSSPYCVDNERFRLDAVKYLPQKESLKVELGIPLNKTVLLTSGKYIDKKRPMDLLKAFELLNHENMVLILVGEGELRIEMEAFITAKKIKNVILTGFINQTQITKYYAIADIYIMTSGVGETWGLSTNEAMNFGLPIILSDQVGCSLDLVKDNGFIYPTGDIISLKTAIEKLSTDDSYRAKLGEKSKSIIDEYSYHYTVEFFRNL
jgi:glycosyltransferase involved in cell wall biosynthesis